MAANVLVDAGFVVALLGRRDRHHRWAAAQAARFPPPWMTCEVVLSETVHLLGGIGTRHLAELVRRGALICRYRFADDMEAVLKLLDKYANVPMGFPDACLVRMTETLDDPMLLATDSDFRVYRRHGRQIIPCVLPA
jgi:predicted nucleic acid-binding protein